MAVVTGLIPDARQEMFRGLIDYAGLFPPAFGISVASALYIPPPMIAPRVGAMM